MKNEYVTGIYETGVSSVAHPWLGSDCLEGEYKLMKQTCHFDYGDRFLRKTYVCFSNRWRLCQRTAMGVETKLLQVGTLKSDRTLWRIGSFLVEAVWLVTRRPDLFKVDILYSRCFPLMEPENSDYLGATGILIVNTATAQLKWSKCEHSALSKWSKPIKGWVNKEKCFFLI